MIFALYSQECEATTLQWLFLPYIGRVSIGRDVIRHHPYQAHQPIDLWSLSTRTKYYHSPYGLDLILSLEPLTEWPLFGLQ